MNKLVFSERHQKALEYALEAINASPVFPYVKAVYLYGSCARGEENYKSDVDLFVELCPNFLERKDLRVPFRLLKTDVMTGDIEDPEVDLKIVVGDEWKSTNMLYYRNVKKDGILICL